MKHPVHPFKGAEAKTRVRGRKTTAEKPSEYLLEEPHKESIQQNFIYVF